MYIFQQLQNIARYTGVILVKKSKIHGIWLSIYCKFYVLFPTITKYRSIYIVILVQISRKYLISEHQFRVNLIYFILKLQNIGLYFCDFGKIMSKIPNFWASFYRKFEVLFQKLQNIVRYTIVLLVDTSRKYLILNIILGKSLYIFCNKLRNIG